MAYTVKESTKGNTAGVSIDDKGYATYSDRRTFTIVPVGSGTALNSTLVRQQTRDAGQIPAPNTPHPNNIALTVRNVSINRVSPILWTANVSYKTKPISPGDDESTDPINLATKVTGWRVQGSDEEIDIDFTGASIQTNALEPITGVTRKFGDIVGTFQKNFLTFNPQTIRGYIYTTNSDVWPPAPHGSFPVGEAFIEDISATPAVQGEVPYFDVNMTVVFRAPWPTSGPQPTTSAKAWYERVRHQGYKVWNPEENDNEPGNNGKGEDTTTPVLLATDGTQLPPGDQVNWLFFQKYGTSTFSSIGFF